jgi:Zn-dependent M28 family amino/carboxypeptidase
MLAVARAFVAMPSAPRRSVYFAAVAAEEQGLLGSKHMAEHPPVPLHKMAAVVNIDGANVWGPTRDVAVIGYGRSSLDAIVRRVAAMQGRVVTPDPLPDRGFFYRSDQFSFAHEGVPAVYAESGMDVIGKPRGWGRAQRKAWEATHYHQPSDEFDPAWDLRGAVEDARLYFHVARLVADADEMPRWNPGDEFEAVRAARQGPPPLPAQP